MVETRLESLEKSIEEIKTSLEELKPVVWKAAGGASVAVILIQIILKAIGNH